MIEESSVPGKCLPMCLFEKTERLQLFEGLKCILQSIHGSLALDSALGQKISKRHFFQDIKNFFHRVT